MLGKKIKQIRIQRNMSQEEMAKELGINRNQLSRIETGKSEPSANVIKKLCVNCSVNLYDLFEIKRFDSVNEEKYNYIIDNCKYISEKDLDFIIRIITLMRDEYLKKINNQNDK